MIELGDKSESRKLPPPLISPVSPIPPRPFLSFSIIWFLGRVIHDKKKVYKNSSIFEPFFVLSYKLDCGEENNFCPSESIEKFILSLASISERFI
jgi:hypothetical protein